MIQPISWLNPGWWSIRILTSLTAPFILPQLGWYGLGSLGMWSGYVGWSLQWRFGQTQFRFLLQQLMLRRMTSLSDKTSRMISLSIRERVRRVFPALWGTLRWRCEHLGAQAVKALPFYLFPASLRPWSRQGIVLCTGILLGYGNIKYLLPALLFLFPVQHEKPEPFFFSSIS